MVLAVQLLLYLLVVQLLLPLPYRPVVHAVPAVLLLLLLQLLQLLLPLLPLLSHLCRPPVLECLEYLERLAVL